MDGEEPLTHRLILSTNLILTSLWGQMVGEQHWKASKGKNSVVNLLLVLLWTFRTETQKKRQESRKLVESHSSSISSFFRTWKIALVLIWRTLFITKMRHITLLCVPRKRAYFIKEYWKRWGLLNLYIKISTCYGNFNKQWKILKLLLQKSMKTLAYCKQPIIEYSRTISFTDICK